jgi:hypothetical protein
MLQTGGCHFDKWNVPSEINLTAADEQSQGYCDRILEILNNG